MKANVEEETEEGSKALDPTELDRNAGDWPTGGGGLQTALRTWCIPRLTASLAAALAW